MKFVHIFGPCAVGKMKVGQELENITELVLFHNHMTREIVHRFFNPESDEGEELLDLLRFNIFEAVANSNQYGMVFTNCLLFSDKQSMDYMSRIYTMFEQCGAEVYLVELKASLEKRILRNVSPNRLLHKQSKRDIEVSEKLFWIVENNYRCNSLPGEIKSSNYMCIDNTDIAPQKVALNIKRTFSL